MTTAPRALSTPAPGSRPSLRILVIEDNTMIADLLADTLQAMGHEVCAIVSTEDQSVAAAALHKPDLLLVDAHLREGDGLSALERIQRGGPVAHVVMTGDSRIGERLDPSVVTLIKPFEDNDLERAIQRAFTRTPAA